MKPIVARLSPLSSRPLLIALSLMLSSLVAGCVTDGTGRTIKTDPVCKAVIGPIKYNSQDPKSKRFAGSALAPDLAKRNRVGQNLGCQAYR